MEKDKVLLPVGKIGGQAIFEGVMMRCESNYAYSVRRKDGGVETVCRDLPPKPKKSIKKLPFIRGLFALVSSMVMGYRLLNESIELSGMLDDEEEPDGKPILGAGLMFLSMALGVALAIGLFMVTPVFIGSLINLALDTNTYWLSLIEGLVRVALLIVYLYLVSFMKDLRRIFEYHGAEHKVINCYEHIVKNGGMEKINELTPQNARKFSRLNKRCGTSFLFMVMVISLCIFMLIPTTDTVIRIITRIAITPVIVCITYEFVRLAGKTDFFIIRILSFPGMMLQKITTKEPDDSQLEIAATAIYAVIKREYEKNEPPAAFNEHRAIMSHVTGKTTEWLLANPDYQMTDGETEKYNEFTERRKIGEPFHYIIGKREFMSLDFHVDERVLIPRPDSEILAEMAITLIKENGYETALDICTGTGCVGISVQKYTGIAVTLSDILDDCLAVAQRNAEENNIECEFIQSDLFHNISSKYDIITANPPYIRTAEIDNDYEPRLALDGGDDGLSFYRRIAEALPKHLNGGGAFVAEIGYDQSEAVKAIFGEKSTIIKDLAGKDRVICLKN
jgi:release factor-specific protein-(glutamine-N5) methyltransferase